MKTNNPVPLSESEIAYILSPEAVRAQAKIIFDRTRNGQSNFGYHPENLASTIATVLEVIRENYPDLKIPFHSRWGHFRAGGLDRALEFEAKIATDDARERARKKLDLVITSVLLDAGAGAAWQYQERTTGKILARSEGLGVASYHLFLTGAFSKNGKSHRADADGLQSFNADSLKEAFQVTEQNPLIGVEGRVNLLNNLGQAVRNARIFKDGRPGNMLDYLIAQHGTTIPAPEILKAVLRGFGSIWPGRISTTTGINLGDVWRHPALGPEGSLASLVPLHKLSQWLTYSLIEPIVDAGIEVTEVEKLTGLAEYRNGGLFLDSGLLSFSDPAHADKTFAPDSELIVEWRALTVYLLDIVGTEVQKALNRSPAEFPLAKVLEGGTWWAGRKLAQAKRPPAGNPPINIQSDGTVF